MKLLFLYPIYPFGEDETSISIQVRIQQIPQPFWTSLTDEGGEGGSENPSGRREGGYCEWCLLFESLFPET